MLVSDRHKFVFVHVPKTGGTSIKRALLKYANPGQLEFDGEKVTDLNGWRPHERMTPAKANGQFKDYFIFGTVRNPWSWHASIWKFFQRPERNHPMITGRSFAGYIETLANGEQTYYRALWRNFFSGDASLVDYIMCFEKLQSCFDAACDKIGLPQMKLPHMKNAGDYDYREMYDDRLRRVVEKKHARDIEMFGYTFEGE